jgi:hypothetical protein
MSNHEMMGEDMMEEPRTGNPEMDDETMGDPQMEPDVTEAPKTGKSTMDDSEMGRA